MSEEGVIVGVRISGPLEPPATAALEPAVGVDREREGVGAMGTLGVGFGDNLLLMRFIMVTLVDI